MADMGRFLKKHLARTLADTYMGLRGGEGTTQAEISYVPSQSCQNPIYI